MFFFYKLVCVNARWLFGSIFSIQFSLIVKVFYCIWCEAECQSYVGCLHKLNRKSVANTSSVSCSNSINAQRIYSSFSTCVCFQIKNITPAAQGIVMKTLNMTCHPWSLSDPFRPRCILIDSRRHNPMRIIDSVVSLLWSYVKLTALSMPMPWMRFMIVGLLLYILRGWKDLTYFTCCEHSWKILKKMR